MLYITATPIGNLEDITLRAIKTLKEVDVILAEDTRTSKKLLNHFEIQKEVASFHSYSKQDKIDQIVERLLGGESMALISDAGTPGISDPSFHLIQACLKAGVKVVPIPGVSAVITALSVSGAPIDKFIYLGFLPLKKGRKTLLETLKDEKRTMVMYESVHRINRTLSELLEVLGDRYVCVAREMTKMFEEYYRGKLSEASQHFNSKKPKGEFTIVIAPESFKG
jgi:16S rRNA (cytidine1402-2'-O)-methyltransferase